MKKRILNNWKTSALGFVLLATCVYTVVSGKATWIEVTPIIGGACILFGIKDPFQPKNNN
jgi:hypothetical protein